MKRKTPKTPAKRKRQEVVAALPTITPAQLIRAPRITRMDTLVQCRAVLRRILKAMAKGEIPSQLGARLAYVANLISTITKYESEIKELTALREKLEQLQGGSPVLLPYDGAAYIPAPTRPDET